MAHSKSMDDGKSSKSIMKKASNGLKKLKHNATEMLSLNKKKRKALELAPPGMLLTEKKSHTNTRLSQL